jgi:hypothetical protein
MTEPIQISFDVDWPVDHAFVVWTARISSWWPRSHTVSAEADASRDRNYAAWGTLLPRYREALGGA